VDVDKVRAARRPAEWAPARRDRRQRSQGLALRTQGQPLVLVALEAFEEVDVGLGATSRVGQDVKDAGHVTA
jgi:hypothetical protein